MEYKENIRLFKLILKSEFNLKRQPKIQLRRQLKLDGDYCFGLYYGDNIDNRFSHNILISVEENKTLKTLFNTLAHEYIHCWQLENNFDTLHDTATMFQVWREYFINKYQIDVIGLE